MKEYNENECCVFRKTKEQYGGLSNMAGAYLLNVNGIRILTAEALYQACRYPHLPDLQRVIINEKSPMAAKMKSKPYRKSDSRKDWEDVRVDIMFWCLKVKLAQNRIHFGTLLNSTMDKKIREILFDVENGSKFMVFHPAWGYFARDYGLVQFPVEKEGKEPKPKQLIKIINQAKKENIKAIIVQKEFSDKAAKTIAKALNIKVIKESPLSPKWEKNLIKMANGIAKNQ